ncbi:MAG: tetratricopeptide repeat protein [Candidatus Acidiferrum sp.]
MFIPRGFLQRFVALLVVLLASGVFPAAIAQHQNNGGDFQNLARAAGAARDANNFAEAIRGYREALKLQPDWQEGLWSLGSLEYERDDYADAIAPLLRLTQLAPQGAPAWNLLGLCEYETKDYANARQHLTTGQELKGTDEEILRVAKYHLALLMIRDADFDAALATLQPLATAGQPSPEIKGALGLATLRIALLPQEVDASKDAMLQEIGNAATQLAQGQTAPAIESYATLTNKYRDAPYLHLAYASALLAGGNYQEAIKQGREEVALSPDSAVAHELLAKSLDATGEHEKAREQFAIGKELQPKEAAAKNRVVELYRNGGAPGNAATRAAKDTNDEQLWNAAMLAYSSQRYSEAISALQRWVENKPNVGTAWAVMGLSEFALKDYDNALIHLQRGQHLGLSGNFESVQLARYRLAVLLLRKCQFENAQDLLMSVADQGPLAAGVRFALGMSLLRIQMLPNEVEEPRKALIADMGEIGEFLKNSQYDRAFPKFEELTKRYPAAPFLHYVYGTALATFSRYDEAKEEFQQEIRWSPMSELPQLQLASIALKQHRAQEGRLSAQQALKLAPRSAEGHYLLGRALMELGEDRQAIGQLESASAIAPQSAQIHFNLAKAYAKAHLPEKATQEREIFARLNALAEQQRSLQGNQSYGAHNGEDSVFSSPLETSNTNTPNHH